MATKQFAGFFVAGTIANIRHQPKDDRYPESYMIDLEFMGGAVSVKSSTNGLSPGQYYFAKVRPTKSPGMVMEVQRSPDCGSAVEAK